jgi:hypothetical protein
MSTPLGNQDTIQPPAARKCFVGDASLNRRARHKGIEGRPQLLAIAILLLQDFVPGFLDQAMRACGKPRGKSRDCCG